MPHETEFRPDLIDPTAMVADNAVLRGNVHVGSRSSVWFGVVARGDVAEIRIGQFTNIQDQTVLHGDPGFPCHIGDRVTVGHAAVVHGATVEDDVLVGMRAVLLNGVRVGSGSLIAAGSLVTEGTQIPPGSLVVGSPAKVRGPVTTAHQEMIRHGSQHYAELALAYETRPK